MKSVLIANRGEIALRVIKGCRDAGLGVVAIYGPGDEAAPHAFAADQAFFVPSYLDMDRILEIASTSGVTAIHPGYGFLAENASFAQAVQDAGFLWIGPPPEAISSMGSKAEARRRMQKAGVPIVPGTEPLDPRGKELKEEAERLGYPVFVKAVSGGGGKGMRIVSAAEDLEAAAVICHDEAERAFGDGSIYLEKALLNPRHIEIQIFADDHGNTVSLFERECSIQRRHQKIVEECPSPIIDDAMRAEMGAAAVAAAEAVGYRNAGTVEFLYEDGKFYMLEMNTRLQVEHPVTEMVTGLDLVRLQLSVATGEPLPPEALEPTMRGHSIECRVYAEDPANGFLPSAGSLLRVRIPQGPGVRVDAALREGLEFGISYDPMLAKVITYGLDRKAAIERMQAALREFVLLGLRTNLEHLQAVLSHPAFLSGDLSNRFLEEHMPDWKPDRSNPPTDLLLVASTLAGSGKNKRAGSVSSNPLPWETLGGWRLFPGEGQE